MLSFRGQYFPAYVFACLRQYKAAEPKVHEVTGPHIFTSMNPLKKLLITLQREDKTSSRDFTL